jgi:hypothetical protein
VRILLANPVYGRGKPSHAVNRIGSIGRSTVPRVEADRFDHELEFVGAINFARYAVNAPGRMGWALLKS